MKSELFYLSALKFSPSPKRRTTYCNFVQKSYRTERFRLPNANTTDVNRLTAIAFLLKTVKYTLATVGVAKSIRGSEFTKLYAE